MSRPVSLLSLALLPVVLLAFLSGPAQARVITDSAGRTVEVPDQINRVYAAGPPAAVMLYVLAPEKMIGWPRAPKHFELEFLAEPYRSLPEIGRLTGRGNTANLERVLKVKPDLIFDFGSIRQTYISLAGRVQQQTQIPYILIDGRFENTAAAFRLLGEILGVPERGEKLARYVEDVFRDLDGVLKTVPEDRRPRAYLARGPAGLETGLKGSINTEILERAGGRNVVTSGKQKGRRRGLVQMSIEQVLVANPDTIVTWDAQFFKKVFKDPLWAGIAAVKKKRVYLSPIAPFGWIDRPPSVNRIFGLKWMAGLFYPDRIKLDLKAETRAFYTLFYHLDLTEAQLEGLTKWANGRP